MQKLNKNIYLNTDARGVSLIIVFFVMIIVLAVVLSISSLLYSEIKIIKNIAGSVVSFYAADGGVEKVLYYDRKIIPAGATRGLCGMCKTSTQTCPEVNNEAGLTCLCDVPELHDAVHYPNGCDTNVCKLCLISFSTTFDNMTYEVEAITGSNDLILQANTIGTYQGVGRGISILNGTETPF